MSFPAVTCSKCGRDYPEIDLSYLCERCGGIYDISAPLTIGEVKADFTQPGIWRYRHTFGLSDKIEPVSLGEGNTPLVWGKAFGRRVAFKCEFLNPTGSFKDRGASILATIIRSYNIQEVIEDSSGNAGAALAAYGARAGIKVRVYMPAFSSDLKRLQIESFGAEVIPIIGSRSDVTEAVEKEAKAGKAYGSHVYLPFHMVGYASISYEILEQLGVAPGAIIVPVGQGGLLLGIHHGFKALYLAGAVSEIPRLIGVQAQQCAPIWLMFKTGHFELKKALEGITVAEGVQIQRPLRARAVIKAIESTRGTFVTVDEANIISGHHTLASLGFYVEPTSALVWNALAQTIVDLPDPVVLILTGSGYKRRIDHAVSTHIVESRYSNQRGTL